MPNTEWFSIVLIGAEDESSGELVGFIDKRRGANLLYIWFIDFEDKIYYVNPLAKKLTPYLTQAPNIDPKWAYDFCKKEVARK